MDMTEISTLKADTMPINISVSSPLTSAESETSQDKYSLSPFLTSPINTSSPPLTPSSPSEIEAAVRTSSFQQWLACVCVVTFDLELGQAMEFVYPPMRLTDTEKSNICYLAFPDSNSSGVAENCVFSFRIRASTSSVSYYYGYVYFRQTQDKAIRRGYFQKSVVLVTTLPFVGLYSQLVSLVAPEYFTHGAPLLEAVCRNIALWPPPQAGGSYELPILGKVLDVQITPDEKTLLHHRSIAHDSGEDTRSTPRSKELSQEGEGPILASLCAINLYECFGTTLSALGRLWELVLTCQPIVVISSSPTDCSNCVLALVSLVSPLYYSCDFRPYFTIYDSDFKEFTTKTRAPPCCILGVTNPYFIKALSHWPHLLKVGCSTGSTSTYGLASAKRSSPRISSKSRAGLFTDYNTALDHKEKSATLQFEKLLLNGVTSDHANNLLRRHYAVLTQAFLIPLEQYFASLMPLQKHISPWKSPPRLKSFSSDDFFAFVCTHHISQLQLCRKGDWISLYRRFISCPNFDSWFRVRQRVAAARLHRLYISKLAHADVVAWMRDHHEVEHVDLLLRLQEELSAQHDSRTSEHRVAIQGHVDLVIAGLPEDLRESLKRKVPLETESC